jgi:hypothetical protein
MTRKKKKPKIRPLGVITSEMEPLLFEMTGPHQMQIHEIIGGILAWAEVHSPGSIEGYLDGSRPVLYGHKSYKTKEFVCSYNIPNKQS